MSEISASDKFAAAIPYVMGWEIPEDGNPLENDPHDPGGVTNYGIILSDLKALGLVADFNHDGIITVDDVKAMKRPDAELVYKAVFDKYNLDELSDSTKFFDTIVNLGFHQASLIMQRALNTTKRALSYVGFLYSSVTVDGNAGAKTFGGLNALCQSTDPTWERIFYVAFCTEQAGVYRMIAERRRESLRYLNGWLRRAYSFPGSIVQDKDINQF
jgi:lysozyme family protein